MSLILKITLSGFVRATNQLWIIGDDLLVSSFHQLMRMRNRYNFDLYINNNYEISAFTVISHNFVEQITSGLVKALNSNTYLPTTLMVILSDIIPGTETLLLKADFYLHKIFDSIKEDLYKRLQQLPAKAGGMQPVKVVQKLYQDPSTMTTNTKAGEDVTTDRLTL